MDHIKTVYDEVKFSFGFEKETPLYFLHREKEKDR